MGFGCKAASKPFLPCGTQAPQNPALDGAAWLVLTRIAPTGMEDLTSPSGALSRTWAAFFQILFRVETQVADRRLRGML